MRSCDICQILPRNWATSETLKNGSRKIFKVDQDIEKNSKEWRAGNPKNMLKNNMNLQHLRSPFFRENLREKMKKHHWKWISPDLHSLDMSLFLWPSGAPFFNCRAPFFRVAVSVGGSGPPFFRSKSLHSLDVTLSGPPRSSKDPVKNGGPQPFYLIQRGIEKS